MSICRFTPQAPLATMLECIERDGAIIVERLIDAETCLRIRESIQPILDTISFGWESFGGLRTKRFGAVASRLPESHKLITHPLVLALVHRFLAVHTDQVLLNSSQFIVPFSGQRPQILHRDRESWLFLPREVEPELSTLWAISPFERENGATRLALGSHKWPPGREPEESSLVRATMPEGSVLVFCGGIIHGGGGNATPVPRVGLALSYCLAWLRPEENHFLSSPPQVARHFDPTLQALLGYTLMSGTIGYYSDPFASPEHAGLLPPEHALGRSLDALPNPDITRPLRLVDDDD